MELDFQSAEGVCGCGECATSGGGTVPSGSGGGGGGGGGTVATSGAMGAPSNGSKTAHSKVATGGGHANTQTSSKRSSSGADGDYQLVQHEVLYSLSAQYECGTNSAGGSTIKRSSIRC
uniref:Uncharacterized protein n=1 Tax=Anopheles culicifacies TaxID=139723 RepID=A0A182LY90_9DIPT